MSISNEWLFLLQLVFLSVSTRCALWCGEVFAVALFSVFALLSNLLVLKSVTLFGFAVTTCDAYAVCALVLLNQLRFYAGARSAMRAVGVSLGCMCVMFVCLLLHLAFQPSSLDTMSLVHQQAFTPVTSVMVLSVLVFMCTQMVDLGLYVLLSRAMPRWSFGFQTFICVALSQAFDTALFSYTALAAHGMPLGDVIVWSYAVKMCTLFVICPVSFVRFDTQHVPSAWPDVLYGFYKKLTRIYKVESSQSMTSP